MFPPEWVDDWLVRFESPNTQAAYQRDLQCLFPYLPDKPIGKWTNTDMEVALARWAKGLPNRPANSTYNRRLAAWNSFLRFLFESKRIDDPIKIGGSRTVPDLPSRPIPTEADIKAIFDTLYSVDMTVLTHKEKRQVYEDRLIFALCVFAGLRNQEIRGLCVGDIDVQKMLVDIPESIAKGKKRRVVALPDTKQLREMLPPVIRDRAADEPLILPLKGSGHVGKGALNDRIRDVLDNAGVVGGYTVHCFRAYFAVQALRRKVPITVLKQQLGHRHIKTTELYDQLRHEHYACGDASVLPSAS